MAKKTQKRKKNRKNSTQKKRVSQMARTKKSKRSSTKRRASTRRASKKSVNSGSMMSGFAGKLLKKALPVGYGIVRDKTSDMIANSPLLKNMPAFRFLDEGIMLGGNALATSMGARKNPIVRRFLQMHEDVELFHVGTEIGDILQERKGKTSLGNEVF